MKQDDTDTILVKRVQDGDKQAFNLLVRKYQFRVRYLVGRFIRDNDDQDDVIQDAFVKAYYAIGRFRGESSFYTWLYRITINTAKNFLASNARNLQYQGIDITEEDYVKQDKNAVNTNTPDKILEHGQYVELIKRAIDSLPVNLKEAIELREIDGLSYEEISKIMKCPIGTVRSRIYRARQIIGITIEQYEQKGTNC